MKTLKIPTDFAKSIEVLSDAEKGRLFQAILNYADAEVEPNLVGNERFVWAEAKKNIDKQRKAAKAHMESLENANAKLKNAIANRKNAYAKNEFANAKEKGEEKESTKEKEDSKRNNNNKYKLFIPPSIEDVREYCLQQGYSIDTEKFVDYYTANGWMVGKNKMKDWKAAVRTWVRNRKGSGKNTFTFADIYAEKGDCIDQTGSFSDFNPYPN